FVFAPIPAAAAGYVIVMGVGCTRILMTSNSWVITAIGPVFTIALLVMVLNNGRAFMQRKCLDLALEEREQTVSLLLREYESSDADWLWQTNAQLCFQNVSGRFARAIGRTMDQLEGRSLPELLRGLPRSDQATRRALAAAETTILSKKAFSELVVSFKVDDSIRSIELSAQPTFN